MFPNAMFILVPRQGQTCAELADEVSAALYSAAANDPLAAQEGSISIEVPTMDSGVPLRAVEVTIFSPYIEAPAGRLQAETNRDADKNAWHRARSAASIALAASSEAYYLADLFSVEEILEPGASDLRDRFLLTKERILEADKAWENRSHSEFLTLRRLIADFMRPNHPAITASPPAQPWS